MMLPCVSTGYRELAGRAIVADFLQACAVFAALKGVVAHKRYGDIACAVLFYFKGRLSPCRRNVNAHAVKGDVLRSRHRDCVFGCSSRDDIAVRVGRRDLSSAAVIARYADIRDSNIAFTDVQRGLCAVALCRSRQTYNSATVTAAAADTTAVRQPCYRYREYRFDGTCGGSCRKGKGTCGSQNRAARAGKAQGHG